MSKLKLEILAYEDSPLGPLCLRRRELISQPGVVVTEVTLNHEFLMSSLYTDSERALAKIGIEMRAGEGLKILVGGLGLGYTAQAALQTDNAATVEVVELLPHVIDWLEQGLVPLSAELIADKRLVITQGDVYQRLAAPPPTSPQELYDVILIDVDHSPDERLNGVIDADEVSFYSVQGLKAARRHLAANGVLGVWSYAENSPFADALREVFQEVRVEPVTHENFLIDEHQTDWLFFAAAN